MWQAPKMTLELKKIKPEKCLCVRMVSTFYKKIQENISHN